MCGSVRGQKSCIQQWCLVRGVISSGCWAGGIAYRERGLLPATADACTVLLVFIDVHQAGEHAFGFCERCVVHEALHEALHER